MDSSLARLEGGRAITTTGLCKSYGDPVAQGTPDELKRLVPGGHVHLQFADPDEYAFAAQVFAGSARDEEALAIRVPYDGRVQSLRALLGQLDHASVEVTSLSARSSNPYHDKPGKGH